MVGLILLTDSMSGVGTTGGIGIPDIVALISLVGVFILLEEVIKMSPDGFMSEAIAYLGMLLMWCMLETKYSTARIGYT